MAIEIKELSISVRVNSDSADRRPLPESEQEQRANLDLLIDECVQRVLEELSHRKEGR